MPPPPGLAEARRTIAIIGAALAAMAVVGALLYSFQETGNGCGSGWAAATKPIPSPLLTQEETDRVVREKLNPYEFGVAKARPIRECRSAGSKRLITAGVGATLVLLPIGAALAYLYWPQRAPRTDDDYIDLSDEHDQPAPATSETSGWGSWRRDR